MEILSSRVLLHPADFDRSVAFYGDIVGLHIAREFGSGASKGIVFFLGGGFLEIVGSAQPPARRDAVELWLQVRDLDTAHATLVAAGTTVREAPVLKPWGLKEMRALDPDGLTLVFVEVPPGHPLRTDTR